MKKIKHLLFVLRHLKMWWELPKEQWEMFALPALFPAVMEAVKKKSDRSDYVIYVTKDITPFKEEFDDYFVKFNTVENYLIINSMQLAKAGNPNIVKYEYYPTINKMKLPC